MRINRSDRKPDGAMLNILLDGEELRGLDKLSATMKLPREEVIRRSLKAVEAALLVTLAPPGVQYSFDAPGCVLGQV